MDVNTIRAGKFVPLDGWPGGCFPPPGRVRPVFMLNLRTIIIKSSHQNSFCSEDTDRFLRRKKR
jgi:hypothetical protein